MDIIVMGQACQKFKPEEVILNLTFFVKERTYNKALDEGTKSIEQFIENVLYKIDIEKEELKTNRFYISEVTNYNSDTKKREFEGYSFNQYSQVKFDYDVQKMTKFMELVSKINNPPSYTLNFSVKDVEECKNKVLDSAYKKAKEKAQAIANASGKTLLDCLKVDFKPFTEAVTNRTSFNSRDMMIGSSMEEEGFLFKEKRSSVADTIEKTFTPEDVEIQETLYCLWKAE